MELASPYTFKFTTGQIDTAGPVVIASSPVNGGTSVSKAYIEFILDQPVNLSNVGSYISVVDSTGNRVSLSKDNFEVTSNGLTLLAVRAGLGLIPGMKYTATLSPGLHDYFGYTMKAPYSVTFTCDTNESTGGSVIEGFESSLGNWQQPSISPLTFGVDTSVSSFQVVYGGYDGYQSGVLKYQFDSTSGVCAAENSQGYNVSSAGSIGMWIFGDNSGNELDFIFASAGSTQEKILPVDTINWYGWKFISMWRSKSDGSTATFKGFAVTRLRSALLDSSGIYVDDIQTNGKVTLPTLPISFSLFQNFPNPFNPTTSITYQLPSSNTVTLKVYDVLGREIETLVQRQQQAGIHLVTFDASKFSSGVYFYKLSAGDHSAVRKMEVIK